MNEGIEKRLKKKKMKEGMGQFWKKEIRKGSVFKKMIEEATIWNEGKRVLQREETSFWRERERVL